MKSFVLKLIVVLIAIIAFNVEITDIRELSHHELSMSPAIEIDPLRDPASRGFEKLLNYIADPFIPIVVLAHSLYEEQRIDHYLPVYPLHRENRFFLLI